MSEAMKLLEEWKTALKDGRIHIMETQAVFKVPDQPRMFTVVVHPKGRLIEGEVCRTRKTR